MLAIIFLVGLILASNQTPIHAAPSTEACPKDSVLSEDICKCDLSSCAKPPCLSELKIAKEGTEIPGQCCPSYECVGCKEDEQIQGKCPCAEGAVIEGSNCVCVYKEKHLVDGKCICNSLLCPLPQLCDKKSVAVTVTEGCCKRTICTPCPSDSESTNIEGDEIEDHCVCLPCKTECGFNRTVVIKKHGSGYPGSCCDLYECKKPEEAKGCRYGQLIYEDGKEWNTPDAQCKCSNGVALCSNQKEKAQSCFVDNLLYKDSETWTKDGGCTTCTCTNGAPYCISHYCDVKENLILVNHSCVKDDKIYEHGDSWTELDGCTKCTCLNGFESCNDDLCETTTSTTIKTVECQPLANCNKTCLNGFKINRRGCEICKCNTVRLGQDILSRYNISMNDLIHILDDYKNKKASTTSSSSIASTDSTRTSSSTTITTPTSQVIEVVTKIPMILNRNAEFFEEARIVTSTTTGPSVKPTDKESDSISSIIVGGVLCIIMCAVLLIIVLCIYKSRRKNSVDLSNCHYKAVNSINNNNTIKKTDQLL